MKLTGTHLGLLLVLVFFTVQVFADDNMISLEQSGDNLNLQIVQIGHNNKVRMLDASSYINNAPNLSMHFEQHNPKTGNLNEIVIDEMSGSGNSLRIGQGASLDNASDTSFYYDGWETGGHYFEIDLYGNNNDIAGYQINNNNDNSGHTANLHIAGSSNDIWYYQKGDGAKTFNLDVYNSDNDISIIQRGNNDTHSADVEIDGNYGTVFYLLQDGLQPNGGRTYSVQQFCNNPAGCSVSVIQND